MVELLIVISILAALAGLLVPVIGVATKMRQKAQTSTRMNEIRAAIERYRELNGMYPSKNMAETTFDTNNRELLEALKSAAPGSFYTGNPMIKDGMLVDIWNKPFFYRSFIHYAQPAAGADLPPNADSYQLWSSGSNTVNENGAGDDMNNWKQ